MLLSLCAGVTALPRRACAHVQIVNADNYLGPGYEAVRKESLVSTVYALSRTEQFRQCMSKTNDRECCSPDFSGCHDGFMFLSPAPPRMLELSDFQQNVWGAENGTQRRLEWLLGRRRASLDSTGDTVRCLLPVPQ